MKKVSLGKTGIEVTELGHGTLIFGHLQAQLSPEEGGAALKRSYDLGVRFIDTAQGYGSYQHIQRFLDDVKPGDIIIASKSHAATYENMMKAVDEALKELRQECIDIFHIHALRDREDLAKRQGALDALEKCKELGKIRTIGISSHAVDGFRAVMDLPQIEVLHPIFNRQFLGLIDGTGEELLPVLRQLKAGGRGIYAMKIFAGGHYVKEMEDALAYVRNTGVVDASVVGMKTPEEVEIDVRLFETGKVSETDREKIKNFTKKLIVYSRCEKCGSCVKRCQQQAMELGEEKARNIKEKCILCGYCAEACPQFAIRVV